MTSVRPIASPKTIKTTKAHARTSAPAASESAPALPLGALHELADWALDLAQRHIADGDREAQRALQRVRRAIHATIDRRRMRQAPSETDVLTTVSLLAVAAERDLGLAGFTAALSSMFDQCSARDYVIAEIAELPQALYPLGTRAPRLAPFPRCVP